MTLAPRLCGYTSIHPFFIWLFFTTQIIHRHKSTCKQDLHNTSISKTPSNYNPPVSIFKTIALDIPFAPFPEKNKFFSFSPGVPGYIWRASCHPPRRFFWVCCFLITKLRVSLQLQQLQRCPSQTTFSSNHCSRPKMPHHWPLYSKYASKCLVFKCVQVNLNEKGTQWKTVVDPRKTHGNEPFTFKPYPFYVQKRQFGGNLT